MEKMELTKDKFCLGCKYIIDYEKCKGKPKDVELCVCYEPRNKDLGFNPYQE